MAKVATKDKKNENQAKCAPNRLLTFRGIVALDAEDTRSGKDTVHMVLQFSDGLSFRLFSPRDNVKKRSLQAITLGSFCAACDLDWGNVPGCFQWEDYVTTFQSFVESCRGKQLYTKVTLNGAGWPNLGSDRCFSKESDMEYSDLDMLFLDSPDGDMAHPGEHPVPESEKWDNDLPF